MPRVLPVPVLSPLRLVGLPERIPERQLIRLGNRRASDTQ